MQVCISYLFIFVPVINEEYYEKDKNIYSVIIPTVVYVGL